jgi:two-component system, LytTR family, response regulator
MRVLIVDDEPMARRRLQRLCEERAELQIIGEAESGAAAIDAIRSRRPNLVLLAAELGDMTGFDVLRAIDLDAELLAVMVTMHKHHAVRACEADAIDFLIKPVTADRFNDAIERAHRRTKRSKGGVGTTHVRTSHFASFGGSANDGRLVAERSQRLYFIDPETIDYIRSDGNYVELHVGSERFISCNTMRNLQNALESIGYLRIERSLLINLRRVTYAERLGHGEFAFAMRCGERLVSSRSHRQAIIRELRRGTTRGRA